MDSSKQEAMRELLSSSIRGILETLSGYRVKRMGILNDENVDDEINNI